ncbi:hypothetical protein K469DRAFT_551468 [Zopfia rhizophila CBS 207.26]|uniref:rRNA-processing protein FYV7 n=1 Tax=Zopfia rhizophila CBS 207.26 TaxID=1314779 RepID=A0A6A6ER20_9PEZI|nr:hypothetical protein K469DRAFT_551468 [Zopfia rhizophila CBS 207.26]
MAPKRPPGDDQVKASKKQKKGFSVGPANLPDGAYKRKVQKIKKSLIQKSKIKKDYAKLKARDQPGTSQRSVYEREDEADESNQDGVEGSEPTLAPHPDRLKLLEESSPDREPSRPGPSDRRRKRPRPQPYKNETELARKRKEEAEARHMARAEAEKERQKKLAERERVRKTMAKARSGGPNGQRKLGRESTVLLDRVKKLVGNT